MHSYVNTRMSQLPTIWKLGKLKVNFLSLIVKILVKALLMITYADTRRDTTLLEHQELDPYFGLDIELDNTYEILRWPSEWWGGD